MVSSVPILRQLTVAEVADVAERAPHDDARRGPDEVQLSTHLNTRQLIIQSRKSSVYVQDLSLPRVVPSEDREHRYVEGPEDERGPQVHSALTERNFRNRKKREDW